MTAIDTRGNLHRPQGVSGAGQFTTKHNTAPAGALVPESDTTPPVIEVVQVSEGREVEYRGRRGEPKKARIDRVWHVHFDGEVIGSVASALVSRERRTRGAMYVNSRWKTTGWLYTSEAATSAATMTMEATSKASAVERLVQRHKDKLRADTDRKQQ